MARLIFLWAIALALVSIVNAITLTRLFEIQSNSKNKLFAPNKIAVSSALGPFKFPQKVDHFDSNNNATFPQRYWVNSTNYRPGGPIIFFSVGEADASRYSGYLIRGETSLLAQKLGGVVIVYEHRYYGESNPVSDLSSKNMVYLTVDQSLADMVNFMQTVESTASLVIPLWFWQSIYPGNSNPFEEFCQVFNNATTQSAQVAAYASWYAAYAAATCKDNTIQDDCFGSYDPKASFYTKTALNNAGRSWTWQTCLEFGYWHSAAPKGHPTLVSRLVTAEYWQRQCPLYFPDSILPKKPRTNYFNKNFGGWKLEADHIFWINGEFDPWRSLSVAAPNAPKRLSTEKSPNVVIKGAVHGWDNLWSPTTVIPEPIVEVHNQLIAIRKVSKHEALNVLIAVARLKRAAQKPIPTPTSLRRSGGAGSENKRAPLARLSKTIENKQPHQQCVAPGATRTAVASSRSKNIP
ncbi:serine carboxypeptidase S28-domain-containing protein [Jimgerdemannia flammicorona]|uniref:Serine carboxypeptidase S28-domain-containing protein n=1 Tax=Jimgerdemannia flammicorona TaxID=994334 RepID=A0A433QSA1_9FUNG|nr:serine carboxypeptidase S28-domain-containing protein [Jimgerdemannia flammicorona]